MSSDLRDESQAEPHEPSTCEPNLAQSDERAEELEAESSPETEFSPETEVGAEMGAEPEPEPIKYLGATRELERCNQLYYAGAYEEAARGYQALINGPGEEKLLANLGYALQSLDRHEEAIEAFESYLKVFIARHHAWKALCFSYYHLADYENMTRCAREAIRWDIRHDQLDDYSWQQMATAHFLMGDHSTALKAARKASALNPQNPFSKYYEACVLAAIVAGAELDEPDLIEEPPTYLQAAGLLVDALTLRPDLSDELRAEGFLDQVFPLLEEARALRQTQEAQEAQEAQEPQESHADSADLESDSTT